VPGKIGISGHRCNSFVAQPRKSFCCNVLPGNAVNTAKTPAMKIPLFVLVLLVLITACSKPIGGCAHPSFACLQGTWVEKVHTDTALGIKEYIKVVVDTVSRRPILFDATAYAQLQSTQLPIGYYFFDELPLQDSVALTSLWQNETPHWYLKMISEREIEVDYGLPPGPYASKKRYIRE
jgi:hypothetical protein